MFINIKLSKLFKIFFIIVAIIMFIFFGVSVYQIFAKSNQTNATSNSEVVELTVNNYTNALKTVHENLDSYIGTKIHFSGYVYRVFDFNENQFVLARNMIIDSNNHAVVVGFLCNYDDAKSLENNSWVEVTGTITKGIYHGDIPIVEINELHHIDMPTEEFVYPPDDSFVSTENIL